MTQQREEARAFVAQASPNRIATRPNQDSKQTQYFRVLTMLTEADEVCSSAFYRQYLPRFSVHIHKARQAGYLISKRPCDRLDHDHTGTCWLYRLEALPEPPERLGL